MSFTQMLRRLLKSTWEGVFAQERTLERAIDHALALAALDCSRTIAHTLCARGLDQQDWGAEYKMFSRSQWKSDSLLDEPLRYAVQTQADGPIVIAADDTKIRKTGTKIPGVSRQRDPMSPPFHANLIRASRYLHAAVVVHPASGARCLPVCFRETPVLKKPGKRASKEEMAAWKEQKKTQNLSTAALAMCKDLRIRLDAVGGNQRKLLMPLDGSFCNHTMFSTPIDGVQLIARCRKDARLALPAKESNRVYSASKFTPEQVRKDDLIAWTPTRVHYGGDWREIRCKQVNGVLWQGGAKRRPLRLIVIAAQPYRTSPNSTLNYRDEAYYLATDLETPLQVLLQAAFDRWQIEVNHREEKNGFGVGEAQLRSPESVPRHPAFAVAVYSLMHLCALKNYGGERGDNYLQQPKWRRRAKRPSIRDLKQLVQYESPNLVSARLRKTQQSAPTVFLS